MVKKSLYKPLLMPFNAPKTKEIDPKLGGCINT